jgi:predicted amidohydrolase
MVFLGHCGGAQEDFGGYNCITVLRRDGNEAWSQAKINSYDLRNSTIQRDHLKLQLLSNDDEAYYERLDLPSTPKVAVTDTPYGRFMIVICEDLSHLEPHLQIAVQAGVTYVIVPILDKALQKGRWYHRRSQALSDEINCTTIIATSAFLERHIRAFENSTSINNPVTVLMLNAHSWKHPCLVEWDPEGSQLWVEGCSAPRLVEIDGCEVCACQALYRNCPAERNCP